MDKLIGEREHESRNQRMYARYKAGQSKAKIGRIFHLSRQRVGIIIKNIEAELSGETTPPKGG